MTEAEPGGRQVPIRTVPAKPKPAKIDPDNQERLDATTRRLSSHWNVETDATTLANQLIEEVLPLWERVKLDPSLEVVVRKKGEPSASVKRKKDEKGGGER
jgi:hypothetical protein